MQPASYKSEFTTSKIIIVWLILLAVFVIPWFVVSRPLDVTAVFAIIVDVLIVWIIAYVKIPLNVIIHRPENMVEYHWMKLRGEEGQICIDINNASFYVDKAESRGGDLNRLTIIDGNDPNNKIVVTQITGGFNSDQIWYMHYELRQIRQDTDLTAG